MSNLHEAKDQLAALLSSSVRYRMISDVPYGIFLSGGIDSSLVAALAQQQNQTAVKTFTIGFKEERYNEAAHAAKIAAHLKTEHHEFTLSYTDALQLCDQSMDSYDEPFADSSAIPTMLVSKHAREQVKMVLTGDGGDELFMGYGMYRWALRLQNPLLKILRHPVAATLSSMNTRYQRAAKLFSYAADEDLRQHIFSQEQYFFSKKETDKLLGRKSNGAVNFSPPPRNRKLSAAEEQALFDLNNYLKDDLLVKVDRATMHYALEGRSPFLDYRLVEFALNVHQNLKMKHGELKILPRKLLADFLPASLFERPKQGFAIPLKHWLQHELKYLIDKYLSEEIIRRHGMIDFEEIEILKSQFFGGRDFLYNRLWNLMVLHRWLEKNILN